MLCAAAFCCTVKTQNFQKMNNTKDAFFNKTTSLFLSNPNSINSFNIEELLEVYNDLVFKCNFKEDIVHSKYHFYLILEEVHLKGKITNTSVKNSILKAHKIVLEILNEFRKTTINTSEHDVQNVNIVLEVS